MSINAYQQSFFFNRAARGLWKRVATVRKSGRMIVSLPYVVRFKNYFYLTGSAPPWAHVHEPVFAAGLNQNEKAAALRLLLKKLPHWASLTFIVNPSDDDKWQIDAFNQAGFTHKTQKTYIALPTDANAMDPGNPDGLCKKRRDSIKCAQRKIDIVDTIDPKEFISFYTRNLKDQGKAWYDNPAIVRDIIAKGGKQYVVVYAARAKKDADVSRADGSAITVKAGEPVAAIACLYDATHCYYWLTTRLQTTGFSDTIEALILHAVEQARLRNVIFDSDGVTGTGTDNLYRKLKFQHVAERNIYTRDDTSSYLHHCREEIKSWLQPWRRKVKLPT